MEADANPTGLYLLPYYSQLTEQKPIPNRVEVSSSLSQRVN